MKMLTRMTFVDTQIDKEHLTRLLSLIEWVHPEDISIKLKQNELDDHDL